MRPNIDDHDYDVKMKKIHDFIGEGDKVKVTLRFRGRDSYESNDLSTPRSTMCNGMPCCFHVSISAQSSGLRNRCLPRRLTNASSISVK